MMSSIAHRLTAAANVPLALLLIAFVVALTSADYANLANGVTMQLIATRIYHDFDPKAGEEYELRDRLFRTGERSFVLIVAGELPGDPEVEKSLSLASVFGWYAVLRRLSAVISRNSVPVCFDDQNARTRELRVIA